MSNKIRPFIWFDSNAEEAMNFYLSVFEDSEVIAVTRYGSAGPGPEGSVMTVDFRLRNQEFVAINGGPHYQLNSAVSFVIDCANQEETDYFWDKLTEGGVPNQCGWLTDKFGVTWQVTPTRMIELLQDPDPIKAQAVMAAMMTMVKIDIAALEAAYNS